MASKLHNKSTATLLAWPLLFIATSITAGCLSSAVIRTAPYLSEEEASYAGRSIVFGNIIHYRLYSVLSGAQPAECDLSSDWESSILDGKKISTRNCTDVSAGAIQIDRQSIAKAIGEVEYAFNRKVGISTASFIVVAPRQKYIHRHGYFGPIKKVDFVMAVNSKKDSIELAGEIASSAAHELYHLGIAHSKYSPMQHGGELRSEEENAYIFGECVRYKSVGQINVSAPDNSDPTSGIKVPASAAQSFRGSSDASRTLLAIVGHDRKISSGAETNQLRELCNPLTPIGLFPSPI